jgi:hypothetical protein
LIWEFELLQARKKELNNGMLWKQRLAEKQARAAPGGAKDLNLGGMPTSKKKVRQSVCASL